MSRLSRKVFVVDDDKFHLRLMEQILKPHGVEDVQLFENGMDCLRGIDQNPQIVFLDHHMDVYNGHETLRKIKRHNPNIFVVMVSGQEEIQTAVDTLKHGAFDYIRKDEKLEENVSSVLQRMEEVRALLKQRKPSFIKSIFNFI